MNRLYIINPASGVIRVNRYKSLINKLTKKYVPLDSIYIVETRMPNDIKKLVEEFIIEHGKEDLIVYVVGGDGTLNEAISVLVSNKIPLVPVPAGTGNDYAKSIYTYITARKIIIESFNATYRTVDVMKTLKGYALNVVNCGFDAKVGNNIKYFRKLPIINGTAKYNLSIALTLLFNKNYKCKIRIDNQPIKGNFTLVAIGKGRFYGGGVEVLPHARLNDKKIDVCLVRATSILEKIRFLPKLKKGKHEEIPGVKMYKCSKVTVVSRKKIPMSIDGETFAANKLKVEILPQVLKIPIDTKK
ncbi:MAG: YegS/Rv2252/BmrU family lipid kinase [Clostridia bacterium]